MIRKFAVCIVCAASLFLRAQDQIRTGTGVSVTNAPAQLAKMPATGFGNAKSSSTQPALDQPAQSQISATLGKDDSNYHFAPQPHGFTAENSKHALSAEFTPSAADLRSGNNHWSIALRGYGYGSELVAINEIMPHANANRLEYLRGGLTEWYVNGPLGLEQGFTLASPPAKSNGEPLTLAFIFSGDLAASVDSGARGLSLKKNGSTVLRYAGLVASDASGRDLPTWLEVAQNKLQLHVDDRGAQYPVTIDPMVQSAKLTSDLALCTLGGVCSAGNAGDNFGYSVSASSDGNTLAVAAPFATGTNTGSGAVYVFVKPKNGWGNCIVVGCDNYVAKITPGIPGQVVQSGFGLSVSLSGDASTLAVLLDTPPPSTNSGAGLIYVYSKPSAGWASTGTYNAILSLYGPTEEPCGPDDPNQNDCVTEFFSSVSVNGNGSIIVLGYAGAVVNSQSNGAAYVFVEPVGGWVSSYTPVKLTASDGAHLDLFGQYVSISSDGFTIAAAAPQNNGYAGAVYVFIQGSNGWVNSTQNAKLTYASGDPYEFLGNSVGVTSNGNAVIAGGNGRGFVFLPEILHLCFNGICSVDTFWRNTSESAQLSGSDGPIGHFTISGDGSTIAAGGLESSPGEAYLFVQPANGWTSSTETQKISASDGVPGDGFGNAVSLSNNGTVLGVGAPNATIGSNANQGVAYVLTGYAGTPAASVSPTSLAFGNVLINTTSASQTVTFTNTGNAPLSISGVAVTAPFTSTQNCLTASPLAAAASCSESVAFAPATLGPAAGTLTFTDNSGGSTTQQVQLSGTGITAVTSTSIASSLNPSTYGQAVTFTAVVTNASGTPTGSVTFMDGANSLGVAGLTGGAASITVSNLVAGSHSIVAMFSGGTNLNPSTSPALAQTVKLATSATVLVSSLNPSYTNQSVTLTASVTSQFGGAVTGNITFKQGATILTAVPLTGAQGSYTTTFTTAGTLSITAVYSGDSNDLGSTSAALKQTVKALPAVTTTALTTSGTPSLINQPVTFTAVVSSTDGPIPDGETVTFFDGATQIGTGLTAGGVASFSTSTLTAKTHTIKATYAGDATFKTSSGTVTQVVTLYPSTTTVTSALNPATFGQAVQFTATVSSGAPGGPTGTVKFLNGTTSLGTATLSGGVAILSTAKLPAGTLSITADYIGDAQSATSSATISQTVNVATTTITVVSAKNPATAGQTVKFTATVLSPTTTPTGAVTFTDGTTTLGAVNLAGGKASYSTTTLSSGVHDITAVYSGTANISGSTSTELVQTVN
jgi:Bacterial Ig-like domain (group 3)/FG-GAP repeat